MSATGRKSFDTTLQLTNAWLNELMEELGGRIANVPVTR